MRSTALALTIALTMLPGCAFLREIGLDKAGAKLLEAVPDLLTDVQKHGGLKKFAEAQSCELYTQRGRGFAELAWSHDWAAFKPMFEAPGTPASDEAYCRKLITDRGAGFVTKQEGQRSATALVYAVALPWDFEQRNAVSRAALMCHEAVHIVWQHRVGTVAAAIDYATVSGRVAAESTGYAITEAVQRRHGWTTERILAQRARRLKGFSELYRLGGAISDACVGEFFVATTEAFAQRSGF